MKIKIITPAIVGYTEWCMGEGYIVRVVLKKPHFVFLKFGLECDVAKQLAVEVSNHLTAVGHADPLMHDIPKLVSTYMERLK